MMDSEKNQKFSASIEGFIDFLDEVAHLFLSESMAEADLDALIQKVFERINREITLSSSADSCPDRSQEIIEKLYLFSLIVSVGIKESTTNPFKRLRSIRKSIGLNQTMLGAQTKTSQATISCLERGFIQECSQEKRIDMLLFMLNNKET